MNSNVHTAARGGSSWWEEARATFALGAPLAIVQLTQFLVSTTEVILVGHLGPQSLAAVALGHSVHFTVWMFCLGITVTVAPLVARALGGGDVTVMRPILHQGLIVATLLGIPATFVVWHGGNILSALGQRPETVALSTQYLHPLAFSMVPSLWTGALRAFISAHSRPRAVLGVAVIGLGFNGVFSYGLIFGQLGLPQLGITGAGIGVTATNVVMFVAMTTYLVAMPAFRSYRLLAGFRFDRTWFVEILRVGIPVGATMVLEVAYFNACLQLMGLLGTDQLAAHQVALQFAALSFMLPLGLGQAATVRVGYNAGAGDLRAAFRAGWVALGLGLACVSIAGLLFWLVPRSLVGLFVDVGEPGNFAMIGYAVSFLAVVAAFQLVDATQAIVVGALRGLKDTRVPLAIAAFGYWVVGLGISVALGFYTSLAGVGIWIGSAAGLATAALLLTWRFYRASRAHAQG